MDLNVQDHMVKPPIDLVREAPTGWSLSSTRGAFCLEISVVVASASIFSTSSSVVMLSRRFSFFSPFRFLYCRVDISDHGVRELRDGSMELSDGLKKLNEGGIEKIVDLAEGDLQDVADRLEATIDVSRRYRSFAGISDDMAGQVKFLYRTNEIKLSA